MNWISITVRLLLLVTTSFVTCVAQQSPSTQNPTGCVENATGGTDLFPDKVSPTISKDWNITYYDTYKILTNENTKESYLLYQCGTEIPIDAGSVTATIEIPVTSGFAVTQTSSIGFLSQLGLIPSGLKAYGNDPLYISNACVNDAITAGSIEVVPNATSTLSDTLASTLQLVFGFPFDTYSQFTNQSIVDISDFAESTYAGTYEWIKYYSTFFNLEALANELFTAAQNEYRCTASKITPPATTTTVMWAYYSASCGGWDVTKPCDATSDYYQYPCEYATACGVELVGTNEGSIDACDNRTFLTTDEFVAFGQNIDVWIYPSPDWNITYATYSNQLSTFKSVTDNAVYDTQAKGDNDWFENRFAQYYDVLDGFCTITGTYNGNKGWFRDVFSDPVVLNTDCGAAGSTPNLNSDTCDDTTTTVTLSDIPSTSPIANTPAPSNTQKDASDIPSLVPGVSDSPSITPSGAPTTPVALSPSRDIGGGDEKQSPTAVPNVALSSGRALVFNKNINGVCGIILLLSMSIIL